MKDEGEDLEDWKPILSQLNSTLLRSDEWRCHLTPAAVSTGWCGLPPAEESEIIKTEKRLGVTLPPSYRSFLSISNGWHPFSNFIERLLPIEQIERFRTVDPEDSALIQDLYQDDKLSDKDYLDHATPEHAEALRSSYYPESLLIGKKWNGGGGELLLLNPYIVFPNGEWEVIFFANWIPGNSRYRSFLEFVKESVDDLV